MAYNYADLALKCLQKIKADYAEVRVEDKRERGFVLKNGILSAVSLSHKSGLGARFITNGSLGLCSTTDLENSAALDKLLDSSSILAVAAKKVELVSLSREKMSAEKVIVKQSKPLRSASEEQFIQILKDVDQSLVDSGLKFTSRFFTLEVEEISRFYANSEGSEIEFTFPRINLHYVFTLASGGQRYWQRGACKGMECFDEWKLDELIVGEARALENAALHHASTPKEAVNLVVGPEVSGIIAHESCGHPYEADRILGREAAQAGESFVTLKMNGQKFAEPCVTVIDDPTVEGSYGYFKFDEEGVKAHGKNLIDQGKVSTLLSDRIHANILGGQSSGNSRGASFDCEPLIRMSNTFFKPEKGGKSEAELIQEAKDGVYIKNFMEWNIDDTRYNQKYVGSEAYLIENGEITKPLLNPILEITTPKLYSSIKEVGNNLEFHAASCGKGEPMQGMPVTMGGPSMLIGKVKLK